MKDEKDRLVTLQIPVTPNIQRMIAVNAAILGITRQTYLVQMIAYCLASPVFDEHIRKVYDVPNQG